MNTIETLGVEGNLPRHFKEFYPKFITLMQNYYDFLRKPALTKGEIQDLLDNYDNEDAIDNSKQLLDSNSYDLMKETVMERQEEVVTTSDGEMFVCKPDGVFSGGGERPLTASHYNENVIKQHYKKFGFPFTDNNNILYYGRKITSDGKYVVDSDRRFVLVNHEEDELIYRQRTLDHPRFIKLLKYIHAIRGTKKGIELFFDIFTGQPVKQVNYPKNQLMVIDGVNDTSDNHIDGTSVLRDDLVWSEFSYIIGLSETDFDYEFIFENIYLPYFHPAGFSCTIQEV